ncbi:MAG: hypothetical protein ACE5D3_05500 [Candidatus Binatia bacterium]
MPRRRATCGVVRSLVSEVVTPDRRSLVAALRLRAVSRCVRLLGLPVSKRLLSLTRGLGNSREVRPDPLTRWRLRLRLVRRLERGHALRAGHALPRGRKRSLALSPLEVVERHVASPSELAEGS